MNIIKRRGIEQAAHTYKKSKMHPDHFRDFDCLSEKEKDLVMKHIAIGEKKENIVSVMNTAPFLWYRQGFALTEDKLYFSKDFFVINHKELRCLKFRDCRLTSDSTLKALFFTTDGEVFKLCLGSYFEEICNFFDELITVMKSLNSNIEQQLNKEDIKIVELIKEEIHYSPSFDLVNIDFLKLGDVVETDKGLFGISQIYLDVRNAKIRLYGHHLTTQKWDGIEFEFLSKVKRLKRNKLTIGKVKCEVDFLEVYLHFPNGRTVELGDDCVHKIDEDNAPREVFYYEYDNCVYFATSEIDNECANIK